MHKCWNELWKWQELFWKWWQQHVCFELDREPEVQIRTSCRNIQSLPSVQAEVKTGRGSVVWDKLSGIRQMKDSGTTFCSGLTHHSSFDGGVSPPSSCCFFTSKSWTLIWFLLIRSKVTVIKTTITSSQPSWRNKTSIQLVAARLLPWKRGWKDTTVGCEEMLITSVWLKDYHGAQRGGGMLIPPTPHLLSLWV